jgi:hypothetical protein
MVVAAGAEGGMGKFEVLHGLHSTPLLHEGRLYLALLHANGHWVIALDKATGQEVWRVERKTGAAGVSREAYASPCLWDDGRRTSLVVLGCDYATGHRLADGRELWRLGDLNPKASYNAALQLIASPVATPDMLLVPTAKGGAVAAVRPGATGLVRPAMTRLSRTRTRSGRRGPLSSRARSRKGRPPVAARNCTGGPARPRGRWRRSWSAAWSNSDSNPPSGKYSASPGRGTSPCRRRPAATGTWAGTRQATRSTRRSSAWPAWVDAELVPLPPGRR